MGEYKTLYRMRYRFYWKKSAMISKHGFRDVLTIPHTMFGEISKANYISPGPSRRHSGSFILIYGALDIY